MLEIRPIGIIHSNIKDTKKAPKYFLESDEEGIIEILSEFKDGLFRIEERTHIVVLFHFHKSEGEPQMHQSTRKDSDPKGVFSTCSPKRPNSIGMSVVQLLKVDGNKLYVKGIDMLDGTPVLDIKPYKEFRIKENVSAVF